MYNFKEIQNKWNSVFVKYKICNNVLSGNNKKYILEMLPYPSGKLHMGHVRNYVIGDAVARFYKLKGYKVIHPMGWDSFGLPAENAAIASKAHPKAWTENNIKDMKAEFLGLGLMYDWDREISTCSIDYYKHEQKIFIDMHKHGLVYRRRSRVNWDPVENTVLANEQVIDGCGWRSGAVVEKRMLDQWSVRITKYAQELLDGLKALERQWPEKVLKMQENWIGQSFGAIVNFEVAGKGKTIEVFTTRPDTLFGGTFVALSPDHDLATELSQSNSDIKKFIEDCQKGSTTTEYLEKGEKNGIFTGLYAKHPVINGSNIPIYIANFVLMDYGTGAVFGCPAHDQRDFEFAIKYNLPIIKVIQSADESLPYMDNGPHINSEFLDGLDVPSAISAMTEFLEKEGIGRKKTTYKFRDWLVSRQRYWGCPIPFIHCSECGVVPVPENELPVSLPDDVDFNIPGNPLERHPSWKHTTCPLCGSDALRDTDTLDTFFESSWYFLRYIDPKCKDPVNKALSDMVMPVDIYIGGVEHAVLHLLYARFFTLALRDMGYISKSVPFKQLLTQGMVCHKTYKNKHGDWMYPSDVITGPSGATIDMNGDPVFEGPVEKMSKSKKNLINPGEIINSHGIDAVRLFIVSDTPPEKDFDWNTAALDGSLRFLNKVWNFFNSGILEGSTGTTETLLQTSHIYIKKITECIEKIELNKAVANIREFFNEIERESKTASHASLKFAMSSFATVIQPIVPFISHDLLGKVDNAWPEVDENLANINNVTIAIQVNGKLRGIVEVEKDADEDILKQIALEALENLNMDNIKKIIVVKNRIVNFVV